MPIFESKVRQSADIPVKRGFNILFLCFFLFWGTHHTIAQSSLAGTYTIGGGNPDFPTIQAAVAGLVNSGVAGEVVFNIRPGMYQGPILFGVHDTIAGVSSTNTITFQSEDMDSTSVIIQSSSSYTIRVYYQQHITFQYLKVVNTGIGSNAYAFELLWCRDIKIKNCVIRQDLSVPSTVTSKAGLHARFPYEGAFYKLVLENNIFTGNGFGMVFDGRSSDIFIQNCVFSNGGVTSIHSNYPGKMALRGNHVFKKVNLSVSSNMVVENNFFGSDATFDSGSFTGNVFSGVTKLTGALATQNVFHQLATCNVKKITDNEFNHRVNSSYNSNSEFMRNIIRGKANFSFCNYMKVNANWFFDDAGFGFCDNNTFSNNFFTKIHDVGICHSPRIFNNNYGPEAPLLYFAYTGQVMNNNFSHELQGYAHLPGHIIFNNNYYPQGGRFDSWPLFFDPQYASSTDLHAQNILLIGKGVGSELIQTDINGQNRANPPTVGANEICISSDTVALACGDAVRLSLCGMPPTGSFQWTPVAGLNNPTAARPVARPLQTTTYVISNAPSGWTDSVTIVVQPLQDLIQPASYSITCGARVFLNAVSHASGVWTWTPAEGLSNPAIRNPVAQPFVTTTYTITLASPGCETVVDSITIYVDSLPVAIASYSQNFNVLTFFNYSYCADEYWWDFGDGATSTEAEPVHTYQSAGSYHVVMVASNEFGSDTISGDVTIHMPVSTHEEVLPVTKIYPNPCSDALTIENPEFSKSRQYTMAIFDALGRRAYPERVIAEEISRISMVDLPKGIYFLQIKKEGKIILTEKIVKL